MQQSDGNVRFSNLAVSLLTQPTGGGLFSLKLFHTLLSFLTVPDSNRGARIWRRRKVNEKLDIRGRLDSGEKRTAHVA